MYTDSSLILIELYTPWLWRGSCYSLFIQCKLPWQQSKMAGNNQGWCEMLSILFYQ